MLAGISTRLWRQKHCANGVLNCLIRRLRQLNNVPMGQRAKAFSLRYTLTNIGYATGPMLGVVIAGVQPLADRFGAAKVVLVGGVLYAVGLVFMGLSDSAWTLL